MHILKKSIPSLLFFALISFVPAQVIAQQFKVLLITETAGWHHESIDHGVLAISELAATHNFTVDRQQEAIKINDKRLKKYDAVIFLSTTADIFDDAEQAAFERYIQAGGGYVGIHAASDTEYEWEWYTKLVGRMFKIHPLQQTARLNIVEHNFPGLEHFPDTLLFTDEWYEFQPDTIEGLHNLILIDETSYDPNALWGDNIGKGMGEIQHLAWYQEYDGGRSFYTALGHIKKVYENQWFLDHLYGGIYYAATGKGIKK